MTPGWSCLESCFFGAIPLYACWKRPPSDYWTQAPPHISPHVGTLQGETEKSKKQINYSSIWSTLLFFLLHYSELWIITWWSVWVVSIFLEIRVLTPLTPSRTCLGPILLGVWEPAKSTMLLYLKCSFGHYLKCSTPLQAFPLPLTYIICCCFSNLPRHHSLPSQAFLLGPQKQPEWNPVLPTLLKHSGFWWG